MTRDPDSTSIARRLFVTNGVDSVLSTIGVIVGTSSSQISDPRVYVGAALGGALSLGLLSGFLGVYLTERSEKLRELREMEKAVMGDLHKSVYAKAIETTALYVALWSLLGSLVLPLIALSPFLVAFLVGPYSFEVEASLLIAHLELAFLGFMSSRSWKGTILYLALGLLATVLVRVLGLLI